MASFLSINDLKQWPGRTVCCGLLQQQEPLVPLLPVKRFSCPVALGGRPAPRSEHSSPLQDEEEPHGAARQTQGVPAAEGERGGGQTEETEGGT